MSPKPFCDRCGKPRVAGTGDKIASTVDRGAPPAHGWVQMKAPELLKRFPTIDAAHFAGQRLAKRAGKP